MSRPGRDPPQTGRDVDGGACSAMGSAVSLKAAGARGVPVGPSPQGTDPLAPADLTQKSPHTRNRIPPSNGFYAALTIPLPGDQMTESAAPVGPIPSAMPVGRWLERRLAGVAVDG